MKEHGTPDPRRGASWRRESSTDGDGIPMGGDEDNERVDVEMELAVGVALDLMGGRISKRQAENRLVEDQT